MISTMVGTIGGLVTTLVGLGHALWIFGILQIFSNVGYYLLSLLGKQTPTSRSYAANQLRAPHPGIGTGAFAVLLLRLTQKRFSATRYAFLSSMFALPRVAGRQITGFAVDAVGWSTFFLLTLMVGIPAADARTFRALWRAGAAVRRRGTGRASSVDAGRWTAAPWHHRGLGLTIGARCYSWPSWTRCRPCAALHQEPRS